MTRWDPTGHKITDDKYLSSSDQSLMDGYTADFNTASAAHDVAGMQAAHYKAVALRLASGEYEMVYRTDFATGTVSTLLGTPGGTEPDYVGTWVMVGAGALCIQACGVFIAAGLGAADMATMGTTISAGTVIAGRSAGVAARIWAWTKSLVGKGNTTTLYRSVSEAELSSINVNKAFDSGNNMDGKWMATTYDDAVAWGQKMDGGNTRIISIELPTSSLSKLHFENSRLDGIANAYYAETDLLNSIFIKVTVVK